MHVIRGECGLRQIFGESRWGDDPRSTRVEEDCELLMRDDDLNG